MKRILMAVATTALGLAMGLAGQEAAAPKAQTPTPHAWGDKNHDGKCDMTGQAVGQGRQGRQGQQMTRGGRGMGMRGGRAMSMRGGRGMQGGMGMMANGRGRGMQGRGRCCMQNEAPAAAVEKK